MANVVYSPLKTEVLSKQLDFNADTFKVILSNDAGVLTASFTAYSQISQYEISGTGYSAGGLTLSNPSVILSGTTGIWDAADVSWSNATLTAQYAAIYDTSFSNALVCCFDFGSPQAATNGSYTIQWPSNGILNVSST